MGFRNVISDGSANPPRCRLQINLTSMGRLPRDGAEWTLPQRLDELINAGFGGIEAFVQTALEGEELAALVHERNLPLGLCAVAADGDELLPPIELAHRMRSEYLSVRVPGSLHASPEITEILKDMYGLANDAGLPLFIQTHRGSVMQDLRRTIKVLGRCKKLRLSADFSQYVLAAQLTGPWPDEIWEAFEEIAGRASGFAGRISYGNQIQDDIGAGEGELAQQYKKVWTAGFSRWVEKSTPGDVLPFTVNLAPPDGGAESFDRWAASLAIKRIAEEAWLAAQAVEASETTPTETAVGANG